MGGVVCWFSPVFGILYQKILSNLRYCIIVVLWRFCIIVNVFRCVLLFCCLNWWHWFMFVFVIGSHFSCHNNWSFDFASVQHISFRLLNLNTVVLLHLRASYLSFLQISQAWEMGSWTWHYHVCNGLVTRVLWCSLGNKGMIRNNQSLLKIIDNNLWIIHFPFFWFKDFHVETFQTYDFHQFCC